MGHLKYFLNLLVFFSVLPVLLGAVIGFRKERLRPALLCTAFLSWVGVIITLCLRDDHPMEKRRRLNARLTQEGEERARRIRQGSRSPGAGTGLDY